MEARGKECNRSVVLTMIAILGTVIRGQNEGEGRIYHNVLRRLATGPG
jgi:hypothetical protein